MRAPASASRPATARKFLTVEELVNVIQSGFFPLEKISLALEMGAFLPDLALTVHPHPTLGEAIMEACKAALGESPNIIGGGQKKASLGK